MIHWFGCIIILTCLWLPYGIITDVTAAPPDLSKPPRVEKLAAGFKFTEGPVVDAQGRVLFSDIPNARIHRFDPRTQQVELFREHSGGANGLAIDAQGRLIMCEGRSRTVTRLEADGVKTLVERFQDKRFNSPNDLCIAPDGGIYFTDPRYGKRDNLELDVEAVYHLSPAGTVRRVSDELARPNGIALSPDAKTLFVADEANKRIVAFMVNDDGSLTQPRVWVQMRGDGKGGPDGIKVTAGGRLIAAGQGGVWFYEPDGAARLYFELREKPTNVALADPHGRVVYVTAGGSLYRLTFEDSRTNGASRPSRRPLR